MSTPFNYSEVLLETEKSINIATQKSNMFANEKFGNPHEGRLVTESSPLMDQALFRTRRLPLNGTGEKQQYCGRNTAAL